MLEVLVSRLLGFLLGVGVLLDRGGGFLKGRPPTRQVHIRRELRSWVLEAGLHAIIKIWNVDRALHKHLRVNVVSIKTRVGIGIRVWVLLALGLDAVSKPSLRSITLGLLVVINIKI